MSAAKRNDSMRKPGEHPQVVVKVQLSFAVTPEAARALEIAQVDRDAQTDKGEQAENVEYGLVEKIETALKDAKIEKEPRDIPIDCCERGADEQNDQAPHQIEMHETGGLIFRHDLFRRDAIGQKSSDAFPNLFQLERTFAHPPETHVLIKAKQKDKPGESAGDVKCNAQPFRNVPESGSTDFVDGAGEFGHGEYGVGAHPDAPLRLSLAVFRYRL
jgi:hypothetical protein